MPIYEYCCPKCSYPREIVLPMDERDNSQFCLCGEVMMRTMSLPRPPIMKQNGNDMALNSLNSKETRHMKPLQKQWAAEGLKKPEKVFY